VTGVQLQAIVAELIGEPVSVPVPVQGGGNNRLYRAAGYRGHYAVKRYPNDPVDARGRYEREFGGLRFLWDHDVRCVPEPLGLAPETGVAVYGWIEGERVTGATSGDVGGLADFAKRLHGMRALPAAAALPEAREAVLAPLELHRQLAARLERLREPAREHPQLARLLAALGREVARRGPAADAAPLDRRGQTLSPADFGFHNALRTTTGLAFLDFEYFGWDDPVKLVSDVLWHPGMALDAGARQMFYARAADVYGVDVNFPARFERDAPSYGLRWALIVLNEFLPAVWARRVAAGGDADRPAVLARQLAKAEALLERVQRNAVFA
jgi:hypothetical protein